MSRPRVEIHIDLHTVLLRDGSILLGKRLNTLFGAGQYHVPAGHLEPNETIIDGAIREAREEVGIVIERASLDLAHVMHFRGVSDRLSIFFMTTRWAGEIQNLEPDKCAGWSWWEMENLPTNTVPYARQALANIAAGRSVSIFGWAGGGDEVGIISPAK